MLKTFIVPFETGVVSVSYKVRVTDRQERRDLWKRAEAIKQACDQFEADYCGNGHKHVLLGKIIEV